MVTAAARAPAQAYAGVVIDTFDHNAGYREVCTFPRVSCGAPQDFMKGRCERGEDACYVSALFRDPLPRYYTRDWFFGSHGA